MMANQSPWKDPDDLIALAEREEQPPLPEGGIPNQRVPGWIRWPIRAVMLPFVILDIAAQRIARLFFRTPYKSVGHCKQRGNCCFFIVMPAPKGWLSRLYYFWNTEINGFYARSPDAMEVEGKEFMVMGCRYLQKDGRCRHHAMRPAVCREWPRIEIFGRPQRLKGCGFKAVPRDKNFDPYAVEERSVKNKLNVLK